LLAASLVCSTLACTPGLSLDRSHRAVSHDSRVQFLVLHYTDLPLAASLDRLTTANVSSHYLIGDEPEPILYQLVDESRRAWHAGESSWQGRTALNAASIGIEIVNLGNHDDPAAPYAVYPPAQIERVVALVRDVQQRHGIKPHRIVGHGEIQPQTKQDPGPNFPWQRLAGEGLVPFPDAAAVAAQTPRFAERLPEPAWFQDKLAAHGFALAKSGLLDEPTRRVLANFQMRYRPLKYDGVPDAETAALLEVVTTPGGLLLRGPQGVQPYRAE
jgi:N-acetylmuramoyl-L-alanine amidase